MQKEFELSVLIGRFQPFHNGHLQIVKSALEKTENLLILIGSSNIGRTTRNPFTYNERKETILTALKDAGLFGHVYITDLPDNPYDNAAWIASVQKKVGGQWGPWTDKHPTRIAITGHDRDQSSFYLKKFPQWTFSPPGTDLLHINATAIRNAFYKGGPVWRNHETLMLLPEASVSFLSKFEETETYRDIADEASFEINYRKQWGPGPFMTVDNVVIQSGHVLLVQRKKRPGKGLFAMPGGHLEVGEPLDEAAVRELWEETQLFREYATTDPMLNAVQFEDMKRNLWPHYRARQCFDNPNRSTRAHVITMAHLFKLPDTWNFPAVVGSDDAERAFWLPLSEMKPTDFFEDHYFIIQKMLNRLG